MQISYIMCSYTYVKIARSNENGRFDDISIFGNISSTYVQKCTQ